MNMEEAVPLGAAMLAGIGTGVYRDEEEACARVRRPGTCYLPDPQASARYRELHARFEKLCPALKSLVDSR